MVTYYSDNVLNLLDNLGIQLNFNCSLKFGHNIKIYL
jgi:hypothetical protein